MMCEVIKICSKCRRDLPANEVYFNKDKNRKDGLYPQCRECRQGRKLFAKEGNKICKKCNEELPFNTDYFFLKNGTKDNYDTQCKCCRGYEYTNKLSKVPKAGYKFCIKCDRELEISNRFFPKDKTCKDGFRNVCRECGKDGHFMEEGYIPIEKWSKEENDLLTEIYPHYLNKEIIHLFPNRTEKALMDNARKLNVSKSEETIRRMYEEHSELMKVESAWINRVVSDEEKENLSLMMKSRWETNRDEMLRNAQYERTPELREYLANLRRIEGRWKGDNNPRHSDPLIGADNPNWKGGVTPLLFWLRNQLDEWKQESMKFYNYTCVLTGKNFDEIHHLTSFKTIIYETLDELGFEVAKTLEEYTSDELELLRETIINNNSKYGYGVCLTKEVHKLFHDTYGYGDNTPEQFEEFRKRYMNGEFNDSLKTS